MKKIRCFTIYDDHEGYEAEGLKEVLGDFVLHVDINTLEAGASEIIISDERLTDAEISELREFWPPEYNWDKSFDGPNQNNDVK